MKYLPEIRDDDVLQLHGMTSHQKRDIAGRDPFKLFLKADELFAKYNYPCTLAVCADGIIAYPEWVEHIKKNKHRYKIELHAFTHSKYSRWSPALAFADLKKAKDLIEETFDVKVTTWYPPFGRKGDSEKMDNICKLLGVEKYRQEGKVDAKFWLKHPEKYPHVNFHYWNAKQVETVNKILCRLHEDTSVNG